MDETDARRIIRRVSERYPLLRDIEAGSGGGLKPQELAALYIMRSIELILNGNDFTAAAVKHKALSDHLRKLLTEDVGFKTFDDLLFAQVLIDAIAELGGDKALPVQ